MKANAKKLLALIMAMVMCLSLAAPAMATGAELGTQALAAQASIVATVTDLSQPSTATDIIKVGLNGQPSEDVHLAGTTFPKWIKVKVLKSAHVGQRKGYGVYQVSVNTDDNYGIGPGVVSPSEFMVAGESGNTVKLKDTAQWEALSDTARTFNVSGIDYETSGSSWQEQQDDGTWRVFFRLATVKNKAFQTAEEKDFKYFVSQTKFSTKRTEKNMKDALATAVQWDTTNEQEVTPAVTIENAGVTLSTKTAGTTTYSVNAWNGTDVKTTVSSGKIASIAFDDDKETGTFLVKVTATITGGAQDGETSTVTDAAKVEELVKEQLEGQPCTVESITATADEGVYTVSVKKTASAKEYDLVNVNNHKGVVYWAQPTTSAPGTKNVAGLYDLADEDGGYYNGSNDTGANGEKIAKGTELLGYVAVKKSDLTTKSDGTNDFQAITATADGTIVDGGTYWVFDSLATAKSNIKLNMCKSGKTVAYVQLVMNKKNGTKNNGLVTVDGLATVPAATETAIKQNSSSYDYEVKAVANWFLEDTIAQDNNKDFVKRDSITVKASSHAGPQKTVVEVTKEATCGADGEETTKTYCTACNQIITSTKKVLPKITDPVEVNKTKWPVGVEPAKQSEKMYFEDTDTHATDHYLKKFEVKTTTNGTVTTKTTTYWCNYGVEHPEYAKTETINKANLQGAGKWNLDTWGTNSTIIVNKATNGNNLWGNTLEIADSDIDDETLPLNRSFMAGYTASNGAWVPAQNADPVFKFESTVVTGGYTIAAYDMSDGTYTMVQEQAADVYTSNTALAKTKTYDAVLVVNNVNNPKFPCLEGSATITVSIYEQDDKKFMGSDSFIDSATAATTSTASGTLTYGKLNSKKLTAALDGKKVTLVKTITKDIVIPATSNHRYTSGATVCDVCGTSRESAQTKAQIFTADTITVTNPTFTGSPVLPKIVVKDTDGNLLIEGIDYEWGVEDKTATAVGEYTLVVKGKGDYVGNRINKTYQILPASEPTPVTLKKQTIKTTAKNKTYKAKNLKKKAASFNIKVTGAKGTLTWKTSNKKIATVKSTAKNKAKVTAVKKAKKGTAKITVKAAKTSAYKASNTLTIKVIVK